MSSIHQRFSKTISPTVVQFVVITVVTSTVESAFKSGEDKDLYFACMNALFKAAHRNQDFYHFCDCWEFLKHQHKFNEYRHSMNDVSNTAGSRNKRNIASDFVRPIGNKKAKEMKQEELLIRRVCNQIGLSASAMSVAESDAN